MGLQIRSPESRGIWTLVRYFLRSFTGHGCTTRKLRNNHFVFPSKLVILTFGDFNNHEFLTNENDKTYKQFNRVIICRTANNIINHTRRDGLLAVNNSSIKNFWSSPDGLDNRGKGVPAILCAHFLPYKTESITLGEWDYSIRCCKYNATWKDYSGENIPVKLTNGEFLPLVVSTVVQQGCIVGLTGQYCCLQ